MFVYGPVENISRSWRYNTRERTYHTTTLWS